MLFPFRIHVSLKSGRFLLVRNRFAATVALLLVSLLAIWNFMPKSVVIHGKCFL